MNIIVSGLERSGTSLVMQILKEGGFPIAFDSSRKADIHNPKGYFELEGGKIIKAIEKGNFEFNKYTDKAIKVTAYGIEYLPRGDYKVIYIERDLDEIILSMDRMAKDPVNREELKEVLYKLNENTKDLMNKSEDIDVLYIKHRNLLTDPETEVRRISRFLGGLNIEKALEIIDPKLYRNRAFKTNRRITTEPLTEVEEELIRKRLKDLGYL